MNEEQRHYCSHLVDVNKTRGVATSRDIYNDRGVLLLAGGIRITESLVDLLIQHQLIKPIEECVVIEHSFDASQMFRFMNKFARNVPGLFNVVDNSLYQEQLHQMCFFYDRFPLIRQTLTVLAHRMPGVYYQALFSAMAGLAIAIKLELGYFDKQTTFIAALLHDAGFLYLDPGLCRKAHGFTSDEWGALQSHPLIVKSFLDRVTGLPKAVGMVVADHHERIDGTGFPRQMFGDKISICSQILLPPTV